MKIVSFMNAYTQGSSGGDVLFVELTKRWKNVEHTVCTSALGEQFCRMKGLTDARFMISTHETEFSGVIRTYVKRILLGLKFAFSVQQLPDIIYVSSDVPCDTLPASVLKFRAKFARKPCKLVQKFYHQNDPKRIISYTAQFFSLALLRQVADVFIGCSQESVDLLKKRGFPESVLYLVRPGVNFAPSVKSESSESSEYAAVFLGRIHPSKGIDDLFPVWQEVLLHHPEAQLALIGKGDEDMMRFYQTEIEKRGLSKHIRMLGFVPDDEVSRLLSTTRFLIFSSHEEGYGMAVAEALAHGCHVVAYDLPVFRKEFGDSVVRVPCYNTDIFAQKVVEYLDHGPKNNSDMQIFRTWEQASQEEFVIIQNQLVA